MTLAFMHIAKTAGTSVSLGLEAALAPVRPLRGFDRFSFGSFDDYDAFYGEARRQYFASSKEMPANAGFVFGHFSYSTLRDAYPAGRFMTVLREPKCRLLSHWLFWRRYLDEDLVEWGKWKDAVRKARLPLAQFLSDPTIAAQTDNLATRALLWPHPLIPPDGFIDPKHDRRLYREARARLRAIDFVDLAENRDLGRRLGLWLERPFDLPFANETSFMPPALRSPLAAELSDRAQALLTSRSRLDLRLWTDVAERQLRWRDVAGLRENIILSAVARHAAAMARRDDTAI